MAEEKLLISQGSFGKTKKRKHNVVISTETPVSALSRRVTRITKQLKQANPTHVLVAGMAGTFTSISTTGTLYDIASQIAQGDDYLSRFADHIDILRLTMRTVIYPGSTSAAPCLVRCSVIKGQSGLAFASNLVGSYNPIVAGTSLQLLYDKFMTIPPNRSTQMFWPVNVNINLKIRHRQKFTGTGAGTTTGDCIYVIWQSDIASGTAAPTMSSGVMEVFFKP